MTVPLAFVKTMNVLVAGSMEEIGVNKMQLAVPAFVTMASAAAALAAVTAANPLLNPHPLPFPPCLLRPTVTPCAGKIISAEAD